MSLNHVTDLCHALVSQILVLVCSLPYAEHSCHCQYIPKDHVVCFSIDLYSSVILVRILCFFVAVHFISELRKFELIITIVELNYVFLSV